MKILITGSNGMVGKNLVENSASSGYELCTPSSRELDLLNKSDIDSYLQNENIDAVIHCAGIVGGIQANIANPVKFFHDNMLMGLNVIMSAREAGVKKLLNLGSSCMYPRDAKNPLSEDLILKGELEPTNEGYAIAKVGAARLCDYIAKEDESCKYKTLIPCNLYGRHDKFGKHNSHMIPAVIAKIDDAVKSGNKTVDIWGDGTARREFMYAGDLADVIYSALQQIDFIPQVVNVGLGHDYSINEYYDAVAKVIGYQGSFIHDTSKPVGMKQKLVDTTLMTQLGWRAKTSLLDGIQQTYEYYLEQL